MVNNHSRNHHNSNQQRGERPYNFIYFSNIPPSENQPPGHNKYLPNHLHGSLFLTLIVQTVLHVSTGAVVMGNDIGKDNIPLIKTMVQRNDNELIIQGSSLKGCIRSIYEAITNSRVGVKPKNPKEYPEERLPAKGINQLCPASIAFGASGEKWGWQGLISIQDAYCEMTDVEVGFIPNLWPPQPENNKSYYTKDKEGKDKTVGWKFYYNMKRAIDKGEGNGIPIQVAALKNDEFTTEFKFRNLKPEELGALLIALGQDDEYPLILKAGAGKPLGLGSIKVEIYEAQIIQSQADLNARYTSLVSPKNQTLTGESLTNFLKDKIHQAHYKQLVDKSKLKQLCKILNPSTNFIPQENY